MNLILLFHYLSNSGNYVIQESIQQIHYYTLDITIGKIESYRCTNSTERWYNSTIV